MLRGITQLLYLSAAFSAALKGQLDYKIAYDLFELGATIGVSNIPIDCISFRDSDKCNTTNYSCFDDFSINTEVLLYGKDNDFQLQRSHHDSQGEDCVVLLTIHDDLIGANIAYQNILYNRTSREIQPTFFQPLTKDDNITSQSETELTISSAMGR